MNREQAVTRIANILAQSTRKMELLYLDGDSPYLAIDVEGLNLEAAKVLGFEDECIEQLEIVRKVMK